MYGRKVPAIPIPASAHMGGDRGLPCMPVGWVGTVPPNSEVAVASVDDQSEHHLVGSALHRLKDIVPRLTPSGTADSCCGSKGWASSAHTASRPCHARFAHTARQRHASATMGPKNLHRSCC